MLWKNEEIGNGYGSPTITADRIYICGEIDTTGYLFAFDHRGKLVWKTDYGKEWVVNYQGSRCAPTVVGDSSVTHAMKHVTRKSVLIVD